MESRRAVIGLAAAGAVVGGTLLYQARLGADETQTPVAVSVRGNTATDPTPTDRTARPPYVPDYNLINLLIASGQMNAQTDPAEIYFRTYGYMPVATPLNGEIVYISKAEYFGHHDDLVVVDASNKPVGLLRVGKNAPEAF